MQRLVYGVRAVDVIVSVKRAHGIASIAFSSGDTLRVPSAVYKEFCVREGEPIDHEAYALLIEKYAYPHAMERAANLLAARDYSENELRRRLLRAAYSETTVDRVLETLRNHRFVSDERFSAQYVARKAPTCGKRRIYQELRQKGVSEDVAKEALESISEDDEDEGALARAEKFFRRRDGNDPDERRRCIAALVRQGYSFTTARNAVRRVTEAEDDLEEE